jgi:hypothetical protein
LPQTDTNWGRVVGAEGLNNGSQAVILSEDGTAVFYNSDLTTALSTNNFAVGTASGIAEISTNLFGRNANLAVAGDSLIKLYDYDGNKIGSTIVVSGNTIRDITYNKQQGTLEALLGDRRVARVNEDGSVTPLSEETYTADSIQHLQLLPNYGNMLMYNNRFYRLDNDGKIRTDDNRGVNLSGTTFSGFGLTKDASFGTRWGNSYVRVFAKFAFQDIMDYNVEDTTPPLAIATLPVLTDGVLDGLQITLPAAYQGAVIQFANDLISGGSSWADLPATLRTTNANGSVTYNLQKATMLTNPQKFFRAKF